MYTEADFKSASFFSLYNDEESFEGLSNFIHSADLSPFLVLLSDRGTKACSDYVL